MAPLADGFIGIINDLHEQQIIAPPGAPVIVYLATPEMRNFAQTEIIKKYFKTHNINAFDAADLTTFIEFHFGGCQEWLNIYKYSNYNIQYTAYPLIVTKSLTIRGYCRV